jgi:fluoride exporter
VSLGVVLALGALGGAGAVLRFVIEQAITLRLRTPFPFGTLVVNLTGATALGALAGAGLHGDAYKIWGTGLLGGYTTFSAWMLESEQLATARGRHGYAAANIIVSLAGGVLGAWLGRSLAAA